MRLCELALDNIVLHYLCCSLDYILMEFTCKNRTEFPHARSLSCRKTIRATHSTHTHTHTGARAEPVHYDIYRTYNSVGINRTILRNVRTRVVALNLVNLTDHDSVVEYQVNKSHWTGHSQCVTLRNAFRWCKITVTVYVCTMLSFWRVLVIY